MLMQTKNSKQKNAHTIERRTDKKVALIPKKIDSFAIDYHFTKLTHRRMK